MMVTTADCMRAVRVRAVHHWGLINVRAEASPVVCTKSFRPAVPVRARYGRSKAHEAAVEGQQIRGVEGVVYGMKVSRRRNHK